ncbi:DUF254-domain-containing protein, partial [Ascobolus immersus RN42]
SSDSDADSHLGLRGVWSKQKKHYFILTSAGKPVYSRHGSEAHISEYMGILTTILASISSTSDSLQTFSAPPWTFALLSRGPLTLLTASRLPESPAQLTAQLDALYTQILSTLTLTQVSTVFARRESYDLRRLLGGTEIFLDGLADSMTTGNPSILLGAIECVKLRLHHRDAITGTFLRAKSANLLYGLLLAVDAQGEGWESARLVSVIRPRRHSLHPLDLQLVFSMLASSSTFKEVVGSEHWLPICLPKFNPDGFLYAYICFFTPKLVLVLVSPDKNGFFEMQGVKEAFLEECKKKDRSLTVEEGEEAEGGGEIKLKIEKGLTPPTIHHFLYRSKPHVQFFSPALPPPSVASRRDITSIYAKLHSLLHDK